MWARIGGGVMTHHVGNRRRLVTEGESEPVVRPLAPIDLQKMCPKDMLWKWCETEELLGTRGAVFPSKFSPSTAEGMLDTRLHDWVQRQVSAFQRCHTLQGLNLFRLVRKRVWKDAGEFRFCDHPSEQQAFDRALRYMGTNRDGLIDSIYRRLCDALSEAALRDKTL
jgi:hypothetical protein